MARMREDEWSMSHNLLQWLLAPCDCCADDESQQDGVSLITFGISAEVACVPERRATQQG